MSEGNDVRNFIEDLSAVLNNIKSMLIDKNRKYGNSALEPIRCFSKSDPVEQIKVRIDDKISRLKSGQSDDTEDVELDLLGYLVLLRIARNRNIVDKLKSMHMEMAQCQQEPKGFMKFHAPYTPEVIEAFDNSIKNIPSNPYSESNLDITANDFLDPPVKTEKIVREAIK